MFSLDSYSITKKPSNHSAHLTTEPDQKPLLKLEPEDELVAADRLDHELDRTLKHSIELDKINLEKELDLELDH